MIQVHYVYWALYFYYYYISSTSDHQALDPGGWGPLLLVCMSLVLPHFPTCSSLCSAISSSMDVLGEGKRWPHRPDHQHAECGFRALGRFSRSCKISISPPLLQIWDHKTCQTASGTLDKCFESQKTKYFRSSSLSGYIFNSTLKNKKPVSILKLFLPCWFAHLQMYAA